MELSREQRAAVADIKRWRAQSHPARPCYKLEGAAGVGKTTVVTQFARELRGGVSYVALTGKAASVLRRKGAADATTIHRLVYHPPSVVSDKDGRETLSWQPKEERPEADLIIADECSMIDQPLGRDLMALGVLVLATGDPFQLPPISGKPFFNGEADFTLTEIHRQAQDSQPLQLAVAVHNGDPVTPVRFDLDLMLRADIVICALHETRRRINKLWRRANGTEDFYPVVGDRVLCFKTNYGHGVLNGELWMVADYRDDGDLLKLRLVDDLNNEAQVVVPEKDFLLGPDSKKHPHRHDSFDGRCEHALRARPQV